MDNYKLKIKRKYLSGGMNPPITIRTQSGDFTIENGKEVEISLPQGDNKINFICIVKLGANETTRTKDVNVSLCQDAIMEISCFNGIINIDKYPTSNNATPAASYTKKDPIPNNATSTKSSIVSVHSIEDSRKAKLNSMHGFKGHIEVYQDRVEIDSKKYSLDEIKSVILVPPSFLKVGYLQVLRSGDKAYATRFEAAQAELGHCVLLTWLDSTQNQKANDIKKCIDDLLYQNKQIKEKRYQELQLKFGFSSTTNQGAALTKTGIVYNIHDNISTFDKWSITETKFIPYEDVEFFTLKGSINENTTVTGGGVNFRGALMGGVLFGGVGALLGSQVGTGFSSTTNRTDERFVFVRSSKLSNDVILATGKDVDNLLVELRKHIPEKEYTEEGGFTQKSNKSSSETIIEEMKMYKELLTNGLITQEEFDTKKKQLLGL